MHPAARMLICALPYLVTVYLLLSVLQPALHEATQKGDELKQLTTQYDEIKGKLVEKEKLQEQQLLLTRDIRKLRSAVPQEPQTDILVLDLERIADISGCDLIGVELPENAGRKDKNSRGIMDSIMEEIEGRLPIRPAAKVPTTVPTPQPPKSPATAAAELAEQNQPAGLEHVVKRVYVSGSYPELIAFLKGLEGYQRVVGVRDLIIALPENQDREINNKTVAAEKAGKYSMDQPVMTFLMSVYYLP